jgi:hypothetical protein
LSLSFSVGLILAVVGLAAESSPTLTALTSEGFTWDGTWDHRVDAQGRSWVAYYDAARILRLRDPDGFERPMVPPDRGQAPSGLAMANLESGVALLWRDKEPTKGLYLARSDLPEAPALDLGGDTEALARVQALRFDGQLNVLWLGEKQIEGPDVPQYNLYFRSVDLQTRALSDIERLMPGIYPIWTRDHQGGLMAFSWLYNESPARMVARYRPAGAETFGETVTIAEVPSISPTYKAFHSGGRVFLIWLAVDQEARQVALQGSYSDDQGKSWTPIAFDDLQGFDVGSLSVAADDSGHILIALSGLELGAESRRQDVRIIRSEDRGETWSAAQPLRPEPVARGYDGRNPMVVFGPEQGQVLVVWEDWREIRARPYFSFSRDHGKTWVHDNVPLAATPGKNLRLQFDSESLFVNEGRFHLIAIQAEDDALQAASLVDIGFGVEDLDAFALALAPGDASDPEVSTGESGEAGESASTAEPARNLPAKSSDALRQRVSAFWEAMMARDFVKTFELQDPFFRSRNDPLSYLQRLGRIAYSEYHINDVRIDGWRAEVDTRVKATIPPYRASTGEILSSPEKEVSMTEVWLWMGDDWYREYNDAVNNVRFTRY